MKYNKIGKQGLISLANSPNFAQLTHLELEENNIQAEGVQALAMSPHMVNLVHLNLRTNQIGSDGLHGLAVGGLTKLKFLNVQYNEVGEEGFRVIADSHNFTRLTDLRIFDGNPGTTTESKNLLKRSPNLQALRFIS